MHPNDPRNIVPNGVPAGGSRVVPFDFAVRTIMDYDVNFLQDRLHSSVFVNGKPTGVYAAMRLDDDAYRYPQEALERYAPDLERLVVDEFMGLGYRKQVRELEVQVRALQAYIDRPRWWQFRPVRRRWNAARSALSARIAPKED